MIHIILVEPEIPPNTGNIIRLAANTGFYLHLVKPLGFKLDDKKMRRAGLDYHEFAHLQLHDNLEQSITSIHPNRTWAFSSKVTTSFQHAQFSVNDALIFGPETRGLSQAQLALIPEAQRLRIPMVAGSRSLNLSNTVAIAVYQAWQQIDFQGGNF